MKTLIYQTYLMVGILGETFGERVIAPYIKEQPNTPTINS